MRILLTNKFYYPRGGDCIHTIGLKELLESKGHDVAIFSMSHQENYVLEESKYWPSEVSFSSKNPINLLNALLRPFGVNEVKKKFEFLLNDFKPDVVHAHNIHSQLSPIIVEIAKKKNIPVVWTLHDYKLICPAYTFLDSNQNVCEDCLTKPFSVVAKKCVKGSLLGSVLGYLEAKKWERKRIEASVDQFISPSKFLKSKMQQAGFNPDLITHIYNFADDEKFSVVANTNRKSQVVYVGRISVEKGVDKLCEVYAANKKMKLLIVGGGPQKEMLEKRFGGENISFVGYKDWDFIKKELSQSSFLIVPSQWYENNPLTIIEALALGTPVLGANIGGIPELIDKSNGMLFDPDSVDDLSEKVALMETKDNWDYKGISQNAKDKFNQDQYYSKLMDLYRKFI